MSRDKVGRREFLKKATALTAATTAAMSFEEHALLAFQGRRGMAPTIPDMPGPMPTGTMGGVKMSRLIAGHNIVGGTAHARDLIYVSQLVRAYFTDDKILDTYQMYEENGIDTAFLRVEARQLELAKRYAKERGGKLQWMAQLVINEKDQTRDLNMAMEVPGVKAAYIRGLEGDRYFKSGQFDVLASALEKMRAQKLVAGLGSHLLDTLIAADREGLDPDFYFKTFNSAQYWSAGAALTPDPGWKPTAQELVQSEYAPGGHDNLWETTPKQTIEFFARIKKPFLAYKVLAAGAIHPSDGFDFAFRNGADFISVGMYDFQIRENVNVMKQLFAGKVERPRAWYA
jgi:hypothetical protein